VYILLIDIVQLIALTLGPGLHVRVSRTADCSTAGSHNRPGSCNIYEFKFSFKSGPTSY